MNAKHGTPARPEENDFLSRYLSISQTNMLGLMARIILAGVFIFSGFQKAVTPPQEFAVVIESYQILPQKHILPIAITMPWVELLFGIFLLAGYWTRWSAAVLGSLSCVFILALLSTILKGISLPNCGCFGTTVHLTPSQAVIFDVILLCLAFLCYKHGHSQYSLDHWIDAGS